MSHRRTVAIIFSLVMIQATCMVTRAQTLPNTKPLEETADQADVIVRGADAFLLKQIEAAKNKRFDRWKQGVEQSSSAADFVGAQRVELARMLGVVDDRPESAVMEAVTTLVSGTSVSDNRLPSSVLNVRWQALPGLHGEGLMIDCSSGEPLTNCVLLGDADMLPEEILGWMESDIDAAHFVKTLAQSSVRIIIPCLVSRDMTRRGNANLTHREFLYRSAFELGRQLCGYEVQKTLAAIDWLEQSTPDATTVVIGWGEGGMIAMYAAALDTRIDLTVLSGYFQPRESLWQEPIDRNIFGRLKMFGDAEIAAMIAPRKLLIDSARHPELVLPSDGGAPAVLSTPPHEAVESEVKRAHHLIELLYPELHPDVHVQLLANLVRTEPFSEPLLSDVLDNLVRSTPADTQQSTNLTSPTSKSNLTAFIQQRSARQIAEIDRYNQMLLERSSEVRKKFMQQLDFSSLAAYEASTESYREFFAKEIIGQHDVMRLPLNARTRQVYDTESFVGYDVVLDVFDDVIAYGVLLVPKNIANGERRPVVVCQHGLEGRPRDIIEGNHFAYHDFAAKLAEQGYVTFAPQNLYLFQDRFRTLQRKSNAIGTTLFSIIVPQHQQIVDWLQTLPFVQPERIAFYGLSYGGKSAMRIPPLVKGYCLSICSADFNEWVWKNASTSSPYSYVWTNEYEIFEFNLGSTFNYAEMAALIAPRPFMVERGQFDNVSSDEAVAYEYAKVRHLYQAKLGIGDRTEIEFFVGPHTINGRGTFEFIHKHLQ